MEYWNIGIMGKDIIGKNIVESFPTFHHSIVPVFHLIHAMDGGGSNTFERTNPWRKNTLFTPRPSSMNRW
jgi:hypothetical protein